MSDPAPPDPQPRAPRSRDWKAAFAAADKYSDVWLGVGSAAVLVVIAVVAWPQMNLVPDRVSGEAATGMTVGDLTGRPLEPPTHRWRGGRGTWVAGDVEARVTRDDDGARTAEFFFNEGRSTPSLIGPRDQLRIDLSRRLLRDPAAAERLGVSPADLDRIRQTRRGRSLSVPDRERQAFLEAVDSGDADRIRFTLARAGNAARGDFMTRTQTAVATLRSVISDDVLRRSAAGLASPPAAPDEAAAEG